MQRQKNKKFLLHVLDMAVRTFKAPGTRTNPQMALPKASEHPRNMLEQ